MRIRKIIKRIPTYLLLIIFSLMTLMPFAWIVSTSLKEKKDIIVNGALALPTVFHFENYIRAWNEGHFYIYYKNSLIVTSVTVVGVIILALLAAYAFVFLKIKGKSFWFTMVILGLLVPVEIILIPTFFNMKFLHLSDTNWALILPQIGGIVPFGIFLLRGFMRNLPKALIESARIDGATELRTLYHIIIPLVRPALITLLIFTAMWSWNNFFLPTVLVQSDSLRTVPLGLNFFKSSRVFDFTLVAAGSNIIAAPILIIYLIFQKSLIKGITTGAIKG